MSALAGGMSALAKGMSALAEGMSALSKGMFALAEGMSALAKGMSALAEGMSALAEGMSALAEGMSALAKGMSALAEGMSALAEGMSALAKGMSALAEGMSALAEGTLQTAATLSFAKLQGFVCMCGTLCVLSLQAQACVYFLLPKSLARSAAKREGTFRTCLHENINKAHTRCCPMASARLSITYKLPALFAEASRHGRT
jgi:X-X-X-Leu-X-X-Gly heptad repeat protein